MVNPKKKKKTFQLCSGMLIDNNWAHLEEAPVEKIWRFYSCSFYPKINSSFIVTYMYWNSFIFQVHLDCFTCATPCGFTKNFFFDVWNFLPSHLGTLVIVVRRAVWLPIDKERDGIINLLYTQALGNPIGWRHPLR